MERVRLVHGNGGRYSHELTERFILKYFTNDLLAPLHDGAQFPVTAGRMAFSTDSYVVQPAFFPGGNIGKLAVCGTVNDLAMNGAIPQYLSCGLILEEGLAFNELDEILHTMSDMAKIANVQIVTGDTKVVKKGEVDKIYINTADWYDSNRDRYWSTSCKAGNGCYLIWCYRGSFYCCYGTTVWIRPI